MYCFDHKGAAISRFVQMLQHVAHLGVFGPWQTGVSKRTLQRLAIGPPTLKSNLMGSADC
jgi:hypothetical protein